MERSNRIAIGQDRIVHFPRTRTSETTFVHLIASCDLLIHGLLHSLVVAFLAAAVRSNRGLRTAIIRMLVFHRSTSALPVHGGPLRGGHSTPACPSKTTCPRSQDDLCGGRGAPRENARSHAFD